MNSALSSQDFQHILAGYTSLLREQDPLRFLAQRFLPAAERNQDLFALAFQAEMMNVILQAQDQNLRAIRYAWWSQQIKEIGQEKDLSIKRAAHPLLDCLHRLVVQSDKDSSKQELLTRLEHLISAWQERDQIMALKDEKSLEAFACAVPKALMALRQLLLRIQGEQEAETLRLCARFEGFMQLESALESNEGESERLTQAKSLRDFIARSIGEQKDQIALLYSKQKSKTRVLALPAMAYAKLDKPQLSTMISWHYCRFLIIGA